ncbi:MAG: VWA domain-containing protein [bacterium]|nr:VWA domain-containing protein [bacterium]
MTPRTALPALLALSLSLGAAVARPARGQVPGESETFSETVQVNVVNVEVYVADKQGRPVSDLTVGDFEIFEDGRPMQIANFARFVNRRRSSPDAGEAAPPPAADSNRARIPLLEPTEVPEDERVRLVVYIDNVNIRPLERKRVMDELRSFLVTRLENDDRVMVVSYDRALNVRQTFTSDFGLVTEALREVNEVRGEGAQFDSVRRGLIRLLDKSESADQALMAIRPHADSLLDTLNRSVDALKELVENLAGLPGRKAVLYVSSGLPMVAGADLFSAVESKFESSSAMSDFLNYDAARRFEELGASANAHGITFYTMDAGGLRPNLAGAAENPGVADDRMATHLYSDHFANMQDPLFFLADETGGRAILNRNDMLPALNEIGEDLNTYYSLGYSPGHFGTGRRYDIQVKVKRRGLRLRYRRSYRDKNERSLMDERTRAALVHAVEDNRWNLELEIGPPEPRDADTFVVPVRIRIPLKNVVLLPRGDFHQVSLKLYVGAMSDVGGLSAVEEIPLGLRIANENAEAARGESWLYTHRLLLRAGRQSLAIGLRDQFSGEAAIVTRLVSAGR